jgi:inner membrane protein
MDTITHGIAGSVLSRAAAERPGVRSALLLGAVAAMFPDADYFFLSGRLDYLANHRSWSHSFVYMPLFALGFALLARLVFRRTKLSILWLFAAIGLTSHILFDWITSFGTMFWVPFSRTRYSLDWVFILDPIFTGIPLIGLIGSLVFPARAGLIARTSAAVLGLYIAFCAVLHHRALEVWRALDRPPAGTTIAALPQFLSPFRWLGLSEEDGEVHAAFFDIGPFARGSDHPQPPIRISQLLQSLSDYYPPPARVRIQRFRQAPESPALEATRALPDVQIYLAFARFPLATVKPEPGGGAVVTWEDLRFLPWFAGPWRTDRREGFRREPFVYRVRLDAAGRPIERLFVTSSERR